jgi:peptidoglycan DL-endopeptidase CwlO
MLQRRRISGAAVAILLLLPLTLPASASPADDARARAASIARQRQKIIAEAEQVNERRLATALELDQLNREGSELEVRLAVSDQSVQNLGGQAKAAAIQAYITGADASGIAAVVQANSASEIPVREGYTGSMLSQAQDVVDQIRSARQDTQVAGQKLRLTIDQRKRLQTALDADQIRLTKAEADLAVLAQQTDAEIVTLVQEEQARLVREAAEKAAAKALIATPPAVTSPKPPAALTVRAATAAAPGARVSSAPVAAAAPAATSAPAAPATTKPAAKPVAPKPAPAATSKPATTKPAAKPTTVAPPSNANPAPAPAPQAGPPAADPPPADGDAAPTAPETSPPTTQAPRQNYPAPSAGAATAVAEALKQLGKPYVFGAAGPGAFDCSGLTQWAWGKAGVSLDHYTGSQWNAGPHVPIDQIQPGDLVFLRVDLGHMGMYIGGGEFIHAPHTGDVVRIAKLSSARVAGVVRPG